MVTCSFLGHEKIYDLGLYSDILLAVKKVVEQNTEIEFIFDKHCSFQFMCLTAILETRQRNPEKNLKTTFITEHSIEEQWHDYWGPKELFPSCVFDKIIQLPEKTSELGKCHIEWRRDKRNLIDRSDFLISYEYTDLRDGYYDLYEYGVRRGLTVFNVAKDETAQAIQDSFERLETKEQYIIHSLENGKSYQAIGDEFSVSRAAIRVRDRKARNLLRRYAWERIKNQRLEHQRPPQTCAVVLPVKMDEEDRKRFYQVVKFLDRQMDVTTFCVEQLDCRSQFVDYLLHRSPRRVELFTHFSESVATPWGSTTEGFVPPFDEVINMDSESETLKSKYLWHCPLCLIGAIFLSARTR